MGFTGTLGIESNHLLLQFALSGVFADLNSMMMRTQAPNSNGTVRHALGQMAWRMPYHSSMASLLGPAYSLRCVLFHQVADCTSEFTEGLGVTLSTRDFESSIRFLVKHYTPVRLSDVLTNLGETKYVRPPVLVTIDDSYASIVRDTAPILQRYGVPALYFVNGMSVGNQDLVIDNLVCYVVNTSGIEKVCSVAREIARCPSLKLNSLRQVLGEFLPTLSQAAVREFRAALASAAGAQIADLARTAQLYIGRNDLRRLASSDIEIGNHTYSHVFCRSLRNGEFEQEIHGNKALLERITGSQVRAFAVPYGSSVDLTDDLETHLRDSGHQAAFLVESKTNTPSTAPYRINRVSMQARDEAGCFADIEIFPRLRSIRDSLPLGKSRRVQQVSQREMIFPQKDPLKTGNF
jgi:peptidoglycan/xylan/chitin deacetylase (PgdA/CDA1 family)